MSEGKIMLGGPYDSFGKIDKGWCPTIGCEGVLRFGEEDQGILVYRCDECGHEVFSNVPLKVKQPN